MFYCKECGNESKKWYGKCPSCKNFNTLVEVKNEVSNQNKNKQNFETDIKIEKLKDVNITKENRLLTKIEELDRVLGGGLVKGSLVLLGGTPGVGKSTLTLQVAKNITKDNKLLYISGEESTSQIKLRSQRLQQELTDNFLIANLKNLEQIIQESLKEQVKYLVIDSIQTIFTSNNPGVSGSVGQLKECTLNLMYFAKKHSITIILIGHVTKDGEIAGPKLLEHMVDTVLYLEGEKNTNYKILRSSKNRYGKVGEIGLFEMQNLGLVSLDKIQSVFLQTNQAEEGTAIGAIEEGDRIIFLEAQALAVPVDFGYPKRTTQGYDLQRLNLLLGLIQKRLNISYSNFDCYLNISTLLKSKTYSLDLAVIIALISAKNGTKIPKDSLYLGEVSLNGMVKSVNKQVEKIKEAQKLGFKKVYCNSKNINISKYKIEIIHLDNITQI